jgi:hypothetical protein
MRTFVLPFIVGIACLAGGFYIGSATAEKARMEGANAALLSANQAMREARPDRAVQYAFAALDRNPDLYSAYELAGDAVAKHHDSELPRRFYTAALDELEKNRRSPVAGALSESQVAVEKSRIEDKLKALDTGS